MAAISAARPLPSQASVTDAHLQHGDLFASAGQVAPALAMYRMAATNAEAAGDIARAMAIHARIARLDPDPAVRGRIAQLQERAGQRSASAQTWDGVAKDELRLARVPHALAAARAALTAEPSGARRLLVADLAQHAGQLELAVEQLQALAIDELAAGRAARAQAVCGRALRLVPEHVPTLRVAVDACLRGRDAHRALGCIRVLLRIDRHDRFALEAMAETFALIGKKDRAAETLRLLAVRLAEESPHARDDARALLRRAIAWRPDEAQARQLQQQLDELDASAPAPAAESTRVLDIGDLVQLPPPRRPAQPMPRRPPPLRRTDAYATPR